MNKYPTSNPKKPSMYYTTPLKRNPEFHPVSDPA